ncbi:MULTISPECIES: hypothetical protein [Priestia]|uniref:hypothetical protein n=1 Tax=Priestia TaxID=2800373 RepID=UPI003983621B
MHEHTGNVSIPRPPRNPLDRQVPRTVVEATVIGSAKPCGRLLAQGQRYRSAAHCLLDHGFEQITAERLGVFGVAVFVREY